MIFLSFRGSVCVQGYQAVYARLGVRLEERGESFYNPMLPGLVQMLMEQGIAEESEGAKVIFVKVIANPGILLLSLQAMSFGFPHPAVHASNCTPASAMCTYSAGNQVLLSQSKGASSAHTACMNWLFMSRFCKSWTNQLKAANADDLIRSSAQSLVVHVMCAELGLLNRIRSSSACRFCNYPMGTQLAGQRCHAMAQSMAHHEARPPPPRIILMDAWTIV